MDNKAVSLKWFKKATDDLSWTEANIRERVYYGACFTAHQAVEKALKAYLFFQGKSGRKIHDLGALLQECSQIEPDFSHFLESILPLSDYYVSTRYPDASDFMDYTEEKAQDALRRARELIEFVKTKIL